MTGTPIVLGFYPGTGSPVDERYLNEGVPYVDSAEVLSLIPLISRYQYLTVNIAGVEYWFSEDDLITLTVKNTAVAPNAAAISIADAGNIFDATNAEDALQEVMGYAIAIEIALNEAIALIGAAPGQYSINLPAAANLAAKIAAATEGVDYPSGWVLAATDSINLTITHSLGKEIDHVTVKKVVGSVRTILRPYSTAYSEVKATTTSILVIEGIDPTTTQTLIHLTFLA